MNERDPLADLLGRLQTETWQQPGHAERLLADVATTAPRHRRWRSWLALAAGAALLLSTLAATGGFGAALRWLGVEVGEVRHAPDGSVRGLTLHRDDVAIDLAPIGPDHEFAEPPVFAYPRRGGGEVRLRILRPGALHLLPAYRAHGSAGTGGLLDIEALPAAYAEIGVFDDRLELRPARAGAVCTLRRIACAGAAPRYGDGNAMVELVP